MIRILHAADLHLDSPFAALDPAQAAHRREEQRVLVRRLAEECERLNCQILLLAGDLFDSNRVYRETAELLCRTLGGVRARVFIAPGNHDPYSPVSPYDTLVWPENVHIFRTRTIEAVSLQDPAVTIYGAAFTEAREPGLWNGFTAAADGNRQIMVIHGTLGDAVSVYNPIPEKAVSASGLDYLALGHTHARVIRLFGHTTAAYPGCAMGRGFDETGRKGALYVELDENGCRVSPVFLGGRVYETCSVPVGDDPLTAIEAALPRNTERDIYRITLTGTAPAPDLDALRAALASRFYGLELVDRTLPPQALWLDLGENSLKGEFLRQIKAEYDGQSETDRRRAADAARLGLAVMEGREVPEP